MTTETKNVSIECNRERLIEALNTATAFSPVRSVKDILKHVCIEVSPDSAVVLATDKEVGCRVSLSGFMVSAPGRFILPPSRAVALLRCMPDAVVKIHTEDSGTVISGERGWHRFPYFDPDEFPTVEDFEASEYYEVPGDLFHELIRRTTFATDVENSRYALGGVLLELGERRLTGVATDGRRLAIMEGPAIAVGDHAVVDRVAIIPSRAMTLMEKAFQGDNLLRIWIGEFTAIFQGSHATVSTRVVEGRFPKWRDVIPNDGVRAVIEFTAGEFLSYVAEASTFCNIEVRGIDFVFGDDSLTLKYSNYDFGSSLVRTSVSYSGKPLTIPLDYRYLLDVLRAMDPLKQVTVRLRDDNNEACVLFTTDDGYSYVLMPMQKSD